jgi:glyoxylase-like metal-dependent hydrolase (beta-lactamase superfamily II)
MSEQHFEQAPGFYRQLVGDMLVTSLNDGTLNESVGVLRGIKGDAAARVLSSAFLSPSPVLTVNAFLLQAAGTCILIDAGCGTGMGTEAGRMAANLRHAGIDVGDIGVVLLTHMHPDHIGGLLGSDGDAVFPNARILVPDADAAVFLDPTIAANVPDGVKPVFTKARAVATAYDGRFERFGAASALPAGITAVPLPGHSPGHTGYRVASGGQSLLIWADVVHVPGLQFRHPEVGMVFDVDPALAERTRRTTFDEAARSGELIAGMHMPFPGFGHLVAEGSTYGFVPVFWNAGPSA